jgi:hypothetical protein
MPTGLTRRELAKIAGSSTLGVLASATAEAQAQSNDANAPSAARNFLTVSSGVLLRPIRSKAL